MDKRSDDNGHTISAATDLAAVTKDTKTSIFFVDKDGNLASLYSGPKDDIKADANAMTPWLSTKLLVDGEPVAVSETIRSIGAVVWGTREKKEVRVYFASEDNTLTELCQTVKWNQATTSWVDNDDRAGEPWSYGFVGYKDELEKGWPPLVHPTLAATSSISAAALGQSNPPQVEIFFTEKNNPDKIACIYSYDDPAYPICWAWGTKYVGDKPADNSIFIQKEKPATEPRPPRPEPAPHRPVRPPPRQRDCYPYVILGSGFGFIFGFILGIVLYEPLGNTRGRPNLWS